MPTAHFLTPKLLALTRVCAMPRAKNTCMCPADFSPVIRTSLHKVARIRLDCGKTKYSLPSLCGGVLVLCIFWLVAGLE